MKNNEFHQKWRLELTFCISLKSREVSKILSNFSFKPIYVLSKFIINSVFNTITLTWL